MKSGSRYLAISAAVFFCAAASRAQGTAQQKPSAPAAPSQEAVQAMIEAATPGPQHAQLMKLAGEYTVDMKFFAQPGAEPEESTGTATLKPILGGRFLEEENSGESFDQPYSGQRVYGYNKGSKQYEAIWIYTGSTAFLVLNGSSDDGGKTVRYSGAFLGPAGKPQELHVTFKQTDDDHFVVRLFGSGPSDSAPVVETAYTRKTAKVGGKGRE
ncbi:MAG TPA: DUF1579 family protein [Candidatus Acidoferrales bacterium]|nr:DUF1579 family protein [Candidatus Acidoferrales bacterium]